MSASRLLNCTRKIKNVLLNFNKIKFCSHTCHHITRIGLQQVSKEPVLKTKAGKKPFALYPGLALLLLFKNFAFVTSNRIYFLFLSPINSQLTQNQELIISHIHKNMITKK